MKKVFFWLLSFVILGVACEIFLRHHFGFTDAVLVKEDLAYEYIAQPNQVRQRFGNKIIYNAHSMRSEKIDTNAIHILGLGDSVLNGGSLTDQDSLATTLLSNNLSTNFHKQIQFLNISAGSWGPDNAAAYLDKNDHLFNTIAVYLFVSSHDSFDNMEFLDIVGKSPNFPRRQYSLALIEGVDRYLIPKVKAFLTRKSSKSSLMINKNGLIFNKGFQKIFEYTQDKEIPLIVVLHPELKELKNGFYNPQGRIIQNWCFENDIDLINMIENKYEEIHYRDDIHLNEKGQKILAETVEKNFTEKVKEGALAMFIKAQLFEKGI